MVVDKTCQGLFVDIYPYLFFNIRKFLVSTMITTDNTASTIITIEDTTSTSIPSHITTSTMMTRYDITSVTKSNGNTALTTITTHNTISVTNVYGRYLSLNNKAPYLFFSSTIVTFFCSFDMLEYNKYWCQL
jgi:hypothetical protein